MNQLQICHQFEGCHDIFIDAFRALQHKTSDIRNAFILTHYHADHYGGLPRGNAYVGPAKIHCTPVTANLLREIHNIGSEFIIPHEYGTTWKHTNSEVTFYDANHCPGAAIVFVKLKLADSSCTCTSTYHLHTGDMRFHEKFKSYPLLQQAVANRQLDNLYLDTTYAKPKHTFIPQEEAIHMIASQVKDLLNFNDGIVDQKKKSFFQPKVNKSETEKKSSERTLVLLSCYSIGKEKVLWQSAVESNQLIYCNKTKQRMLRCIKCHKHVDAASGIIDKCTDDKQKSDIHIITMGTAGSMHPYFQANFDECALYAHRMNKGYSKVVAFIPTGWADSSKYNKENAVSTKTVDLKELLKGSKINGNEHMIKVEVRLVAYSEHSSYNELRDCVEFMKPKRIIPTVFSGEKDYIAIEKRFRDLVDSHRAKQAFINTIGGSKVREETLFTAGMKRKAEIPEGKTHQVKNNFGKKMAVSMKARGAFCTINKATDGKAGKKLDRKATKADDMKVAQLVSMGFSAKNASESLIAKNNDLEKAIEWLLIR